MKRVLTALVLAPTVLYVVLAGPPWSFFLVVALVAGLCYWEYSAIAGIPRGEVIAGILAGTVVFYVKAPRPCCWLSCCPPCHGDGLAVARFIERSAGYGGADFGLIYIYGAWKTAFLLHAISPYWLTFGLLVNWIGDTGAYTRAEFR